MDQPPPPDYHPDAVAPPGRTIIIDSDSDDESIDCTEPAHWGVKAECSFSPAQLVGAFACAMGLYLANCLLWTFLIK